MTDKNEKPRSSRRMLPLAVLAGIAAGAVAVYVTGMPSGNRIAQQEAGACAARTDLARLAGELAVGEIAGMAAADPVPLNALGFEGPDATPLSIADFAGKTLLLNLWATWCAPCRAEMPALDNLQRELGGDRFEVVAINVEKGSDEKPKAFLDEIGVSSLAFYRDDTLGIFNELRSRSLALGLPVTLLIGPDGCLLANMNGPAEWDGEDAKGLITGILDRVASSQ